MSQPLTTSARRAMLTGRRGARVWDFWPTSSETRAIKDRITRLEKNVVGLIIKVRKMAQGQAHFEQSFTNLQQGITDLGSRLDGLAQRLVAAHEAADDAAFESHARELDTLVNQVQNLGAGNPSATTSGASPTTTTGASTGDLPQNAGPVAPQETAPADAPTPPAPPSG